MISIDFDKLQYVCKVLVSFQDMLSDHLKRARRASDDIRFTPIEMVSCPSIGRLEIDMRNAQRKGEKVLADIEDLLRFIRYAIDRYKDADSRIARELVASNLIPGLEANLNLTAFNVWNDELVSIIDNTEVDEKKQEMIDRNNKSARGDYYKEYLKACKDPIVMSGMYPATMYRIDPIQQYTTFVYDNNISLESYINAMGPQWELAWKGRTIKDELRDMQLGIDVLGFSFPVIWLGTEGTNMGIDIMRGDKISALQRTGGIVLAYVGGKVVVKAAGWLAKDLEEVTDPIIGKKIIRDAAEEAKAKPNQIHHFATNKSKKYTQQFDQIANKYNLDLDDTWNKEIMPHQGRHPYAYHDYMLEQMKKFDKIANGNQEKFLKLYEQVKQKVISNPDMLTKDYWNKK